MKYLLGIDFGGGASKATLLSEEGKIVAESQTGKRKCTFVSRAEIPNIVKSALQKRGSIPSDLPQSTERLPFVLAIGEAPCAMAGTVSDRVVSLPLSDPDALIASIQRLDAPAVLFGSDGDSKALAPRLPPCAPRNRAWERSL